MEQRWSRRVVSTLIPSESNTTASYRSPGLRIRIYAARWLRVLQLRNWW